MFQPLTVRRLGPTTTAAIFHDALVADTLTTDLNLLHDESRVLTTITLSITTHHYITPHNEPTHGHLLQQSCAGIGLQLPLRTTHALRRTYLLMYYDGRTYG